MLVSLKHWSIILLSLTLVVTLFHFNSLLVDFSNASKEIVVPSQVDNNKICISLFLDDDDEDLSN